MFVSSNRSNFEPEKTLLATVASDIPTTMTSAQTSQTQNLYQCRLCLKRTPTRVNIFGGDFPKMLEILTSIKVCQNDGLPKYSCKQCSLDVKQAVLTKTRIIRAYKYLRESLKKRSTPSTSTQRTTIQSESPQKIIIYKFTPAISNERDEPDTVVTSKCPTVSLDSQKLETPEELTSEMEVKYEPLDESGNSNDVFTAAENTDEFTNEIRRKLTKQTSFTCKICNISFPGRQAYYTHSLKHKKVECHVCGALTRKDNFKKHMIVHSGEPAVCPLCGVTFKNIVSLAPHMRYQHQSQNDFICEECGVEFKKKYYLDLHRIKVHTGERNFKCGTCGKAFFTKGDLWEHDRKTHKKLRPYICEYCQRGFSSQYALKTHKRQHTNERPFVCDHCNEGFRQKVSLRSHLKSQHGIEEAKEFICAECGRGFATNFALNVHQKLHGTIKCGLCSESFAGREYLNNHMKQVHGVDDDIREDESHDTEEDREESEPEEPKEDIKAFVN
ncbi:unnamed protein product [Acanthoscelides obtectus]|uniref:Uncharacterized protein n=1 Tax=Acanthoscelides obtectus TaxID=200917 RepID=A0A9P0KY22_ACAOB|nr:unnamed protein product [Acanthoscelides obtectus]CAK1631238.1 Zinc finger protein 234 [Acanthoscelides obtectus]